VPTPQARFPPAYWAFPFLALVLAIAVLPVLAAPVLALYAVTNPSGMLEPVRDYVSFIVLIGGLFVIARGIVLDGDLRATPGSHVVLLGLGSSQLWHSASDLLVISLHLFPLRHTCRRSR
jgi:hypothetical protein